MRYASPGAARAAVALAPGSAKLILRGALRAPQAELRALARRALRAPTEEALRSFVLEAQEAELRLEEDTNQLVWRDEEDDDRDVII